MESHLLQLLNEAVKDGFQNLRDSYFLKLLLCTWIVVFGVIAEEAEYVLSWKWVLRILPLGIAVPKNRLDSWARALSKIGWVLIVIGVAGEGLYEARVSRADGWLQDFSNILLASAQRQAADAIGDAGRANQRASENERQAALARSDAKKAEGHLADALAKAESAKALAKGYDKQIAESKAQAEAAHAVAESERLERIKLEAAVAPRSLSLEQQRQIAAVCRQFAGHRVLVSSYGLDGEGAAIGAQIITLLRSVLGNDNVLDSRASIVVTGGFQFGIHLRGPDSEREFIRNLSDALTSVGHLQTFVNQPPPRMGAMMGGGGQGFPAGTVFVDVMIGIKPVPILPSR